MKSLVAGALMLVSALTYQCGAPPQEEQPAILAPAPSPSDKPVILKAMVQGEPAREAGIGRIFINRVDAGREVMAYARLYAETGVPLAEGSYSVLQSEYFLDDDQGTSWGVLVRGGASFQVTTDTLSETVITLQRPTLKVETRLGRPAGSGDDALVIAPGTAVYMGRQVTAPNGMVFTRSMRGRAGALAQIEPQVRVLGPEGAVVTTGAMEYGWGDTCGFSWRTHRLAPGRYTVIVSVDTGPFFGVIEGRQDFIIQ